MEEVLRMQILQMGKQHFEQSGAASDAPPTHIVSAQTARKGQQDGATDIEQARLNLGGVGKLSMQMLCLWDILPKGGRRNMQNAGDTPDPKRRGLLEVLRQRQPGTRITRATGIVQGFSVKVHFLTTETRWLDDNTGRSTYTDGPSVTCTWMLYPMLTLISNNGQPPK